MSLHYGYAVGLFDTLTPEDVDYDHDHDCWHDVLSDVDDEIEEVSVQIIHDLFHGENIHDDGCEVPERAGSLGNDFRKDFWYDIFLPAIAEELGVEYEYYDHEELAYYAAFGSGRTSGKLQLFLHDARMVTEWPALATMIFRLYHRGVPVLDANILTKGLVVNDECVGLLNGREVCHMLPYVWNPVGNKKARTKYVGTTITPVDSLNGLLCSEAKPKRTGLGEYKYERGRRPPMAFPGDWAGRCWSLLDTTPEAMVDFLYDYWKENMQ